MTTCYHSTNSVAAAAILEGGFRDNPQDHPLFGDITGVFLSEDPLSDGDGFPIGTPAEKYSHILRIEFEDNYDLGPYLRDSSWPRIWIVPAAEINENAVVTLDTETSDGRP